MVLSFKFDAEKAEAAITYLAKKLASRGLSSTYYPILKFIYFAEMDHLKRYGMPLVGDRYIAMKQGPVPSASYNLVKSVIGRSSNSKYFAVKGFQVIPLKEPDMDEFSDADLECLDRAFNAPSNKSLHDRSITSTYKETARDGEMSIENILKDLDGDDALIEGIKDYAADQSLFT